MNQMLYQITAKLQLISGILIASTTVAIPVNAQPITPAADGTDTVVNQQGNTINITGGQTSSDGGNLFHSFDKFGVNTGQTANFQSSSEINNILGRVVGGNASIINGILQVTGGNSNLFLMNPAGILFGPNAILNVPADFTATTATGIGFGENNWFNSIGDNNWANLVGTPSLFAFDLSQPGWVVNFADLTLDAGQNLTLLGGGVITEGNLAAPGGNISIAAVPGENTIRISQPGNVLSLDVDIATPGLNQGVINPLSLPELLTGGDAILDATQVQHNADGTITLTSSSVTIDPNSDTELALVAGEVAAETSGQVNVLTDGGNIILDQVDSDTVNVNANGGNITQVDSDSLINASAVQLQTEGEGGIGLETEPLRLEADNLEATAGSGGAFFEVPNGDVTVGGVTDELTGMSITDGGDFSLEAVGNITVSEDISTKTESDNAGSITLESSEGSIDSSGASLDATSLEGDGGLITLSAFDDIEAFYVLSYSQGSGRGGDISLTSQNAGISASWLSSASVAGDAGLITLDAFGDIQTTWIYSYAYGSGDGGDISLTSQNGGINVYELKSYSWYGNGGSVNLDAQGDVQVSSIYSLSYDNGEGGDISLTSQNGGINTNNSIYSSSVSGNGGSVTLNAFENIQIYDISSGSSGSGQGGNISLTSQNGAIDASLSDLNASSGAGNGGSVTLNAFQDIQAASGWISSVSYGSGQGGDISLTSQNGAIDTRLLESYSVAGDGGSVALNAFGDVQARSIYSYSEGNGQGGEISLGSQNGGVDANLVYSASVAGDGGSVTLNAVEDVQASWIYSYSEGSGQGGEISLTSQNSGIDAISLNSSSGTGDGGAVTLNALGNIETNISSGGGNSGGNIQLSSVSNNIYSSELDSASSNGTGGDITLTAGNTIATGNVTSTGLEQGGNIHLTTDFGDIDTSAGSLNAQATSENGLDGNIAIAAHIGNITIGELNGPQNISITDGGTDNLWGDNPSVSATADADNINSQTGQVSIQAHNDITVNEAIVADSIESLALAAGRNININADIDTAGNNGDITLQANHNGADLNYRQPGSGNITMAPGTTLNSGSGDILLQLGTLAEVGDMTLANLNSTGTVTVINPGGNIFSADPNSLINANAGIFQTYGSGGIGTPTDPINITLNNLEASAGSGGAYFNSPNGAVTVGGASENISGLSTSGGGEVSLIATGNITVNEDISSFVSSGNAGNITLTSEDGAINATGNLSSSTSQGNAGAVTLNAAGNITTSDIDSFTSAGNGGDVTMTAEGEIKATGDIDSTSLEGDGGNVAMTAEGDIAIDHWISTSARFNSGNITITSNSGEITTNSLETLSILANAGSVTIGAAEDIRIIEKIKSEGELQGGNITLTSHGGAIDTTQSLINTISEEGQAGSVSLTADSNIQTGRIASFGKTGGGDITLTSDTGFIDTTQGRLDAYSSDGDGGSVVLRSPGEIRTRDIFSSSGFEFTFLSIESSAVEIPGSTGNAGDITLESTNSTINTSAGILNSRSVGGSAGQITLDANNDIRTGFVVSSAGSPLSQGGVGGGSASSQGGDITITSHNGAINTTVGDLSGEAEINPTADVSVLETASIFADNSANLEAYSQGGTGGDVSLSAPGDITTSHISAFGPQGTGNVDLTSNNGGINTGAIFSFSENGNAGNVTLNAASDINTSHLSAWGNQAGGNITINGGGNFNIGEATIHSFSENGNAGDVQITTRGNTTLGGDANRLGIRSAGHTEGGDITIRSYGNIDSTPGDLETYSETGIGGDVYLHADASVTTENIRTFGPVESGDITIISGDSSVNTASLETVAPNGTSGNININSFGISGNIQTANLTSAGEDGSGNITVVAEDGSVITENITSQATEGDSGDITVDGQDDVETGDITSEAADNSGDISVSSEEGSATTGDVTTVADTGDSGDVSVTAQDNVQTEDITSQAAENSGNILVDSEQGSATTGNLATVAETGDSGDATVTAQDNVQTENITSNAGINSGDISVNSESGSVTADNIATVAETGSSGNVAVRANNDIQAVNISSVGELDSGDISVTSETGNINTADIETVAETGDSGDIDLVANEDINTEDLISHAGNNSGDISLITPEGEISTGDIETIADQGTAGDITADALENITTGDITSSGGSGSGDINLSSANGIVDTGEVHTDTGDINIYEGGRNNAETSSPEAVISVPTNTQDFNPAFNPETTQTVTDNNFQVNLPQLDNLRVVSSYLPESLLEDPIATLEESRSSEYAEALGLSIEDQMITTASAREILGSIAEQTGTESAVVYVTSYKDQLELIIFTAEGAPIRATVPEANRQALMQEAQNFRNEITNPLKRRRTSYLAPAQQLYQWLIAPIEAQLQAANIDTILFSMDAGLRGLPIAALHDGQQFLIEKYSLSFIPSVSLMDARYQSLQGTEVLAMGADTFPDMAALPGASVELELITDRLWPGTRLFNQEFTRENLQQQRESRAYDIVHFATHADFKSGEANQTFIYFWNDKLPLDDLRDLGLNHPPVELLVLSACRTAVGDEMAELGFAGLAVRTGVKSVLASLWYVSDDGTLGLMTEFYQALNSATIKSEALRSAQIAMIQNRVQISSSQLQQSKEEDGETLPPALARLESMDLSHPYYWSAFTMIGSPW